MICPNCGYAMDAFDKECPRCHGKAIQAPPPPVPQPPQAQPPQAPPPPQAYAPLPPTAPPYNNAPPPLQPSAGPVDYGIQTAAPPGCLQLLGALVLSIVLWVLSLIALGWVGPLILVVGSTIWVYTDATALGVRKGQIPGLYNGGPGMWAFGTFLLWIVGFPSYLAARPIYKQLSGYGGVPARPTIIPVLAAVATVGLLMVAVVVVLMKAPPIRNTFDASDSGGRGAVRSPDDSPSNGRQTSEPNSHRIYQVRYSVRPTQGVDVIYKSAGGEIEQDLNYTGDWSRTFEAKGGTMLSLTAQCTDGSGSVKIYIEVDGRIVREDTASGKFANAIAVYALMP